MGLPCKREVAKSRIANRESLDSNRNRDDDRESAQAEERGKERNGELEPVAVLDPAAAVTAINVPLVGVMNSVRPAPYWYARTTTWRERPIRSDIGTSTGIVSTACPLTLGIGPCRAACTSSMPSAESVTGRYWSGVTSVLTTVSMIRP